MKPITLTYRTYIVAMLLLLGLSACSSKEDIPQPEPLPEQTDMPIRWSVKQEGMEEGRALINNDAALQSACSTGGKAIGIWSAYEVDNVFTKNVLGSDTDVSLIYQSGTTWDNWNGWTYGEKAAFWKSDAVYYFNAYFPKEVGMTNISNTETSLSGTYNTITTQEDLMVERVRIDTGADDFKGSPVNLVMKHALATLQFIFQMKEGAQTTEQLKSFSLDNTLKTSGKLLYNTADITIGNWQELTASEAPVYVWESSGLSFSATETATAYTGTTTTEGSEYCNNNGHVLIIPQKCESAPTFSCMIGEKSFNDISLGTTQFDPGKHYIYTIMVSDDVVNVTLRIKPWNELDSSYDITF